MGALAIRQIVPDSLGQADDEPGISGPPWAGRPVPIDRRGMSAKPPFRTPVFHRNYLQKGITDAAMVQRRQKPAPTIQLPIRSSLAQVVNRHIFQNSHYVSWIKPFGMAPGYPVAKVVTLINSSPKRRTITPLPQINHPGGAPAQPRVGSRGYMGSPRRFTKALPTSLVPYNPPVYSGETSF